MPSVIIETRRGLAAPTRRALLDAVHDALVECFRIPDHDRTQRLLEFEPENFDIPPGRGERYTVVTIAAFAGRSIDAKRALYKSVVDRFESAGIPKQDTMIVLHDVPRENWGLRGGIAGSDLELGFKVDV